MKHTIWASIPKYTNYIISIDGDVISLEREVKKRGVCVIPQRVLNQELTSKGYKRVTLFHGGRKKNFVHRLLCKAFYREYLSGEVTDHINSVVDDSRLENLRITSPSVNVSRGIGSNTEAQRNASSQANLNHTLTKDDWLEINTRYDKDRTNKVGKAIRLEYGLTVGQFN